MKLALISQNQYSTQHNPAAYTNFNTPKCLKKTEKLTAVLFISLINC